MPVMDGIAATKEIRRLGYNMPIVAATASFSDSDRATCLEAGMVRVYFTFICFPPSLFTNIQILLTQDDVLPKPFTKPAVLAAVLRNLKTRAKDPMQVG